MRAPCLSAAVAIVFVLLPTGVSAVAPPPTGIQTSDRSAAHPYAAHVFDAARRFGVPETWIWAVMRVESGGDARAVSSAGAMGLMQIMPGTWATLRARYGLGVDPFDVRDNIMAGAAYLREMHDRYGDPGAMLAAYNAGPGRYDAYLRGRPLPGETVAYLGKLAPIIGSSTVGRAGSAPTDDPFAWRRAALFVRTASPAVSPGAYNVAYPVGDDSAVAISSANTQPDGQLSDNEAAVTQPSEIPADTLFVRRADTVQPQ